MLTTPDHVLLFVCLEMLSKKIFVTTFQKTEVRLDLPVVPWISLPAQRDDVSLLRTSYFPSAPPRLEKIEEDWTRVINSPSLCYKMLREVFPGNVVPFKKSSVFLPFLFSLPVKD